MNLEPMPWTQLRTIADAQALIAASGREDIGILVDALHFWRAGNRSPPSPACPRII